MEQQQNAAIMQGHFRPPVLHVSKSFEEQEYKHNSFLIQFGKGYFLI